MATNPFDQFDAPASSGGNPFDSFDTQASKPPALTRSWGRAAADLGVGVAQGAANLGGGLASLADTVTGGALSEGVVKPLQRAISSATGGKGVDAGGLSGGLQATSEALDAAKSDVLRQRQQELADTEGFFPSAAKVVTDPVLLSQFAAEQVPIMGTLGVGAASAATRAGAAAGKTALARGATAEAAKAAAADAGTAAATRALTVAQPVMSAGFAAQQAQAQALQQPEELWNANPEFVALVAQLGGDRQAAKEQLARRAGLIAAPVAAGTSLLASRLTAPLEAQIFTRALPATAGWRERATQVGGGIAREAGQETVEEGGEQFAGNLGVQQAVNPQQSLMEGVPEAAGAAAAAGGAIGGVMVGAGQFTRAAAPPPAPKAEQPPAQPETLASQALPAASQPPAGPITAAAAAAQASGAAPAAPAAPAGSAAPAAPAAPAERDLVADALKVLAGAKKGKVPTPGKLAQALNIDRKAVDALLIALEQRGVVSRADDKNNRRLLMDPTTGAVVDPKETARLDRKAEQKEVERLAASGPPGAAIAAVEGANQPPPLTRNAAMFGPDAEARAQAKRTEALARQAARPDPAAGPTSAAAAAAVDTGAAEAAAAQRAAAEAESAQQAALAEQDRAAREAQKAERAAAQQQRQMVQQQRAEASIPDLEDIRAVVASEMEQRGRVNVLQIAQRMGVKPRVVDAVRMDVARARARGEPIITEPPIDAEFTDVTDQTQAVPALPAPDQRPGQMRAVKQAAAQARALSQAQTQPGQSDTALTQVGATQLPSGGPPVPTMGASEQKVGAETPFDDTPEVLDDDITTASGSPFTLRGAAELAAKRTPGARVVEVDGGFVARLPRAGVGLDVTAAKEAERDAKPVLGNISVDTLTKAEEAVWEQVRLTPERKTITLGELKRRAAQAESGTVQPAAVPAPSQATVKDSLTLAAEKPKEAIATDVAGEQLDDKWTAFAPETGTLNVPRAQMPQIKSAHRGAMVQFLGARGITSEQAEVPADSLKPTQAEFSAAKVKKAIKRAAEGEDRAILVSADGHVLDGHHQWLAKREAGAPVKVIRLDAPIAQLLEEIKQFPSATTAAGATQAKPEQTQQEPANAEQTARPEQVPAAGQAAEAAGEEGKALLSRPAELDSSQDAEQDGTTEEGANGTPESDGAPALDTAPAGKGRGAQEAGAPGSGADSGSPPRVGADSGADGAGVSGPRGGRSGKGRVPAAETGAAAGGRLGGPRAGRARKGVPGADAAVTPPAEAVASTEPTNVPAINFKIDADLELGKGGEVGKFNDNVAAIRALKLIESERRRATPEEQRTLARWVGWGGLASAFPNPETGKFKDGWEKRGNELRELLTPSEYQAARRSTRNAHFTSETVVGFMWDAVRKLGYRGGLALESSMGSGNFLGLMPDDIGPTKFIGVEYDSITARLAAALYPQATVLHSGFQSVPLPNDSFDLSIGNPPFGNESLRFQYKPELRGLSIHNQFFLAAMDALKPGGLQVQVVSNFLLDAQDSQARRMLADRADLVAAFRLPDTAFKENARTEVVTDVLILRKREFRLSEMAKDKDGKPTEPSWPDWVSTGTAPDPLGGDPIPLNNYFIQNPDHIIGTLERSGKMRAAGMPNVRLEDPSTLGARLQDMLGRLRPLGRLTETTAERTERAHKLLSEAMGIAVANQEPGHMAFDAAGGLVRVIEREHGDETIMQRQQITADSPWSPQLFVDAEGRWYKVDVRLGEDGKPLKQTDASGAPTRFNAYTRTVYATEAEVPSTLRLGKTGYERLKGMVALRDLLKQQLVLETEDATAQMEPHRKKLAAAYRAYVAEHGPVNRRANAALLSQMPDGALVLALESSYEPERTAEQAKRSGLPKQAESVKPAPILSERVVPKYEPATKAETPADALAITLAESGRVDMERIAALLGQDLEQAADALTGGDKPLVFKDPESNTYETADAYLSGQVVRKLQAARAAGLEQNIKALQAIQPEPWGAENVSVQMGATWVPADVYATFAQQLLGAASTHASFAPVTNTFSLTVKGVSPARSQQWNVEFTNKEGRRFYMSAVELLQSLLNSKTPVMGWTDQDGRFHVDKDATTVAIYKGRELATEFGDWIFKDSERRARLVGIFNERYNTRVTRQYDGQHLTLPGKVPDTIIKMRRHQKNAIWRGISSRFLLIDHVVGAGKTFTAIARAMERRRMGLARKPTIVVPNHLVEQWQADIYRLYPGAKVLAATKADFEMKRRRRLLGRVATGDYDIVVLPHSSFGFIGIAPETELRYLEEDLAKAVQAVKDAEADAEEEGQGAGNRRFKPMGVKEAERLVTAIENRIAKLREGVRDRLLTFEQLGIDDLTIDEAHEFKNLFYSSRLTKVRGMGDKHGSRKAADLYNKARLLRDSNGSVVFMTGTPVSNSVVELYSMMRYLASNELAELGMEHFDAWRAQFVDAAPAFEPNEAGQLKEVTRLGRSWSNMRSLMDLYYSFTDAVTIEDIKKWYAEDNAGARFPVPVVKGGDRQLVKMDPTPAQEEMLSDVLAGFNSLDGIQDIKVRNATRLRLMDRARKLSLDARAVDPTIQSKEEGGKLEKVSKEVKRIYDQWSEDRGTQLIFLDRSVPKAKGDDKVIKAYDALVKKRDAAALAGDDEAFQDADELLEAYDANEIEAMRSAQAGGWNAYQQIKDNLVAMGIPAEEIRFVQEANTDEQKQALFDAVNGGKVRVLIGSTPRMGAGTNVQKRLVGLHHVDVTWKPSDIEQREGRIVRFGNDLLAKYGDKFEVEILAYATERTVDAKMWSLNATKLKAINGLRKYTGDFTMEVDDEESVSMAEMAALASGNPLLLERVTLEAQLNYLELQEKSHRRQLWGLSDALDRAQRIVDTYPAAIEDARVQQQRLATEVDALVERAKARRVTVDGEVFDKEPAALKAALASIQRQQAGNENARYAVTINGARLTNRKAIDEAIGSALGDASAFEAEVGGSTYTERTAAGRAVADALSPKVEGAFDINASGTIGQMLGMPLNYEIRKAVDTAARKTVAIELWLEDEQGRTVASAEAADNQVGIVLATAKMRDLMGALASEVAFKASPTRVSDLQRTLERSKRDVADIGPKVNAPFPKTAELEAKRARLSEVIARLTGTWIEPERKPIPPDTRGARPTWLQDDGNTPDEARFEGEGGRPYGRPVRELTPDEMRFESDGGRASFAKSGDAPRFSPATARAWQALADIPGTFQRQRTDAKSFEDIARAILPDAEVIEFEDGATITVPPMKDKDGQVAKDAEGNPGKPKAVTMTILDGQLAMDASQLQEGVHRGSALYSIALAYAHNNGVVFIPDPADVSEAAMQRRGEHMLSSALKYGTTRHMVPHEDQGLDWRPGDDQHNVLELIRASADNVLDNIPETESLDYDWDSGRFIDTAAGGKPVTTADFERIAESGAGRKARAGVSTLRRGVVSRSLERRAGTPAWRGVVTRLLQLGRAGIRGSQLEGILYGRGAASKGTDPARLRALFKGIAARLKDAHGIDLQVLDSADALPQSIRDQDDYDDTVQAVITGDRRTVYLIANRIRSPEAALKLAAHELVGHFAMEEMLGARLFGELQQRIKALADAGKWPEVFAEVRRRYERNADGTFRALDDATFAAEAIAVFAEKNIRTSILQRAINAVRGFLRRIFPQLQLSQGELRQMLWEAGQYLEGRAYRPEVAARALGEQAPKAESLQDTMERYAFGRTGERDTFYSALLRAIEEGKGLPKAAGATQWKQWLDGAQRRGEIKQSERDWIGLDAWLDGQQGNVTRDALAEYVRANRVQVQEVVLSEQGRDSQAESIYDSFLREMNAKYGPDWEFEATEEEVARRELLLSRATTPPAKYGSYRTPGGENYRELLLTLPAKPIPYEKRIGRGPYEVRRAPSGRFWVADARGAMVGEMHATEDAARASFPQDGTVTAYRYEDAFTSSHWDQPNVLAHVRFDEREVGGKRVLFVQEIQSDWHQAGRKNGYGDGAQRRQAIKQRMAELAEQIDDGLPEDVLEQSAEYERLADELRGTPSGGVPDAPLKQTDEWAMLAFKRVARWSVDNGFDTIAWTTGEQAAEVFDLSKQVGAVGYRKNADGTYTLSTYPVRATARSEWTTVASSIPASKVDEYVGKDVAKRILDGEGSSEGSRMVLTGKDLKVGGAGMRGFYDKILPAAVGKWAKKFGASVGQTQIIPQDSKQRAIKWDGAFNTTQSVPVHSIDITPQMRAAVAEGQPLFAKELPLGSVKTFADLRRQFDTIPLAQLRRIFQAEDRHGDFDEASRDELRGVLERWVEDGIAKGALTTDGKRKASAQEQRALMEGRVLYRNYKNLEHRIQAFASREMERTPYPLVTHPDARRLMREADRWQEGPEWRALLDERDKLGAKLQALYDKIVDPLLGPAYDENGDTRPDAPGWGQVFGSSTHDWYDAIIASNEQRTDQDMAASFAKGAEPSMLDRLQEAINPDDTTLLQRIKDKWADWRPAALGALTLRHLGELAKGMLPAVSYYSDLVQRMASMRNELQESGHEIMQKGLSYLKANRDEAPKLFELLHDATIKGIDPALAYKPLKMPLHDDRTLVDVTKESVRKFIKELQAQMRLQPGSAPRYNARIKDVKKLWKQEQERATSYPELRARWKALSTPAKDQWVAMRDAYIRQSKAYEQALLERIQALDMGGAQKAATMARMRAQFEAARVPFYVPLARWGEYWVSGYTADGERVFLMTETQAEQRRALEQMKAEGVTGGYMLLRDGEPLRHKDGTARIFGSASLAQGWAQKNPDKAAGAELRLLDVAAGVKLDKVRQQDGASGAFMVELQKTLKQTGAPDSVLDEVYQLYLRTLPDLSIRKNFIHRKKTAGYSQDALRAFAGHVFHGSFQIARLAYGYQLEGALRGAEGMARNMATDGDERANAAGRIVNELKRRHEWVMNPQDNKLVNKLSGLGFVWYLGITPGAALVNLLQTPMVTLPVLASKYGANKATAALLRASKEAMGTYGHIEKKLSPDELEAYNELRRRGAIDKTQAHNLAGVSESDTHAYNPFWHKVMTVIGHLFHKAEVINREASGMAAYRLARDAGKDKIAAIKEAEDAIWESHFDYSNANRARFMQSGTAKVLLMFRQFALNMTWFLARNAWNAFKGATPEQKTQARRKLAGVLGMHAVFAGTLGLPLMSVTFGVLNAVAAAFGDDDEPWDAETEFRTFLRETLGDGAAEAVLRGPVQAATGVNIAQRVSLNDLWFRDADRELEGRAWANYLFEQAAGPLGGIVTNYARGRQLIDEGHLWRGVETMMPKAVKDGMKAVRFQTEGVNTLRGDPVIEDFGVLEALGQLTGLAPARVAEQFDVNRDLTGYADHILNRRRALMDAFAMAVRMEDNDTRAEVLERMLAFSRKYPELAITSDSLRRSLVQRARYSAQAQGGVVIDRRLRERLGMEQGG